MSVLLPGETPRPGSTVPPAQDYLRVLARQVFQEIDRLRPDTTTTLRQVTVASRDPTNKTCGVWLGGDTSSEARARPLHNIVPVVGQLGWVAQTGSDLMLVGMQGVGHPKAKLRSTATNAVTTEIDWDFAGGSVEYDTDFDGSVGLYNAAGGNLVARWPGVYEIGASGLVASSAGNIPVALLQELGSGPYYAAWQQTCVNGNNMHFRVVTQRFFQAGQGIQLRVRSAGGSSTFGDSDGTHELGTSMWMSYMP